MERKRHYKDISLPHKLIEKIIRKGGADALSLYMFYVYTGNWQKTDKPRATEEFCCKALEFGHSRYIKAKKILESMKLIKTVQPLNEKKLFAESYVQLLSIRSFINNGLSENKTDESDFEIEIICPHCSKALFMDTQCNSAPLKIAQTYKQRKINRNASAAAEIKTPPPLKKRYRSPRIRMIMKDTCPFNYDYGEDTDKYKECEKCEIWDDCNEYREDWKGKFLQMILEEHHKFNNN